MTSTYLDSMIRSILDTAIVLALYEKQCMYLFSSFHVRCT